MYSVHCTHRTYHSIYTNYAESKIPQTSFYIEMPSELSAHTHTDATQWTCIKCNKFYVRLCEKWLSNRFKLYKILTSTSSQCQRIPAVVALLVGTMFRSDALFCELAVEILWQRSYKAIIVCCCHWKTTKNITSFFLLVQIKWMILIRLKLGRCIYVMEHNVLLPSTLVWCTLYTVQVFNRPIQMLLQLSQVSSHQEKRKTKNYISRSIWIEGYNLHRFVLPVPASNGSRNLFLSLRFLCWSHRKHKNCYITSSIVHH